MEQTQKPRKIPQRQCLGCNEHKPKRELLRVVRSPEGETDEDVLTQICLHYLKTSQCPRYMSHEKVQERRDYVKRLVDEYHADGVMYEQLKFCEYWGYERALASYVMSNDYGVPTAAVDRQYTASASGQLRTRVQAFVESLEIKKIQKERQAKENG